METGRHNKQDIASRTCPMCQTNEIEDEQHFILNCKMFTDERKSILAHFKIWPPDLTDAEKFLNIMNSKNENIIKEVAKYTYTCFRLRERYTVSCLEKINT